MKIEIKGHFAPNSAASDHDVRLIKNALNRLGYYQPYEKVGITGIPDSGVFTALKAFQKDHGLKVTGTARPGDDTIETLAAEASKTPDGHYIWRTVEDDRVRSSHAELNRTLRAWADSPDPTEEYNCRCWAEHIPTPAKKPSKKRKCFTDAWEEEAQANLIRHEEDVRWPYLDTSKVITVGIGANIDNHNVFIALPWRLDEENTGPKADKKQIEDAYKELRRRAQSERDKEGKFNTKANDQENWIRLRLEETERKKLFQERFAYFKLALSRKFADFKCFPAPAKIALMDMIFNLGETKFSPSYKDKDGKEKGWSNLFAAVEDRDWEKAAKESHRQLGKDKNNRNQDTYEQFMQAAEIEEDTKNERDV